MVVRRHLLISVVKLMSLPSSIGATFIDLGGHFGERKLLCRLWFGREGTADSITGSRSVK